MFTALHLTLKGWGAADKEDRQITNHGERWHRAERSAGQITSLKAIDHTWKLS